MSKTFSEEQMAALDLATIETTLKRGESVLIFGRHYATREALPPQVAALIEAGEAPEAPEIIEGKIQALQQKLAKSKPGANTQGTAANPRRATGQNN